MLLSLLTAYAPCALADFIPFTRPKFGIEVTFSNDIFQEMGTEQQYNKYVDLVTNREEVFSSQLANYYNEFPKQIELYSQVVIAVANQVFPGVPNTAFLHKSHPSSKFIFAPEEFISLQFEWQAIEMQAHAGIIPTYLERREHFDKIYQYMKSQNLAPDREYGNGHIHMGVDDGPPLHPEVMRNFIVRMMNFDAFWPLVGVDIESVPIDDWRRYNFFHYLSIYDRLLEQYKKVDSFEKGKELSKILFEDLNINVNLRLTETINTVEAYSQRGELLNMKIYLGQILSRVIRYKMVEVLGGGHAFVYNARTKTFEFRRIPSQENVDEMVMWMSVLEGHWRAAHQDAGQLVKFINRLKPPPSGYDEIKLFNSFILTGGQDPENFRHFLPRHLKRVRAAYQLTESCELKL